jgi:hypothetical protein
MFYGNRVKMCEHFALNWQQNNWLLHHGNALSHTSVFTREFLTKNNMTHPPYFLLSPTEDKSGQQRQLDCELAAILI